MIGLTHYDAHDLLNVGPAELSTAERGPLAAHLDQCPDCRGYATDLTELHSAITRLFRARWQVSQSRQAAADAALARLKQRQVRRRTTQRVNAFAFAMGLIALMVAMAWLLNRPAAPTAQQTATLRAPSAVPAAGSQITLAGVYGAEDRLWPGSTFTLTLRWQTSAPITTAYMAFIHVLDDQGNLVAQSDGVPGGRGTTTWTIGETIDDVHLLSLPDDVKPGPYQIVVGMYDARTGTRLRMNGQDTVHLMTITVQSMQQPIHQDFGDFARLLGVDGLPDSVSAGEAIDLTLYWRPLAPTTTSYLISLQVFDENKGLVAQVDGVPGHGARPTTGWRLGEIIVDPYTLNLPSDLQPGQYRLLLLMFDSSSKAQVFTREGNGAITLATFEVKAKTSAAQPQPTAAPGCPVTVPNGNTPPDEPYAPEYLGNGALWTVLWPNGDILMGPQNVEPDGSLSMKFVWRRGVKGKLTIEGRRLDAEASPLRADIPDGYGDSGIQVSALIFPTEGCWEVTGRVGDATLTFVTRVTKDAALTGQPAWVGTPAPINAPKSDQPLIAGIANGDIVVSGDGGLLWFIWENTKSRMAKSSACLAPTARAKQPRSVSSRDCDAPTTATSSCWAETSAWILVRSSSALAYNCSAPACCPNSLCASR